LRAGAFIRRFTAGDGREVILRAPEWDDLDDMLEFINSLVEEEAMIAADQNRTRESEIEWLARNLADLEKGKHIAVVAEVDGRMVANCEVNPRPGRMSHVGSLGISVKDGYRGVGIGQELMREAERHAVAAGIESIILEVFSINERAIHVYEKMGYRRIGAIPGGVKYRGEHVDSVYMLKELCSS
jgi:RimJ/RimL family protein N-acetyltransferase